MTEDALEAALVELRRRWREYQTARARTEIEETLYELFSPWRVRMRLKPWARWAA